MSLLVAVAKYAIFYPQPKRSSAGCLAISSQPNLLGKVIVWGDVGLETPDHAVIGEFPGVDFAYNTGGMLTAALNFGLPSPIDIKVQGSDLHTLDEIARSIQQLAAAVPGAVDVRIGQRLDYPQLDIEVDRIKAAQLGLTQEDVIKNVVTALNSSIGFDSST